MKKSLSVVLSVALLSLSLFGCGTKAENNSTTTDTAAKTETTDNTAAPADTTTTDAAQAEASSLDPVTIKMWFTGSQITDDSAVMAEVNKILGEKLNVTLEPIWGTWADFDDTVRMSINGGEEVDIYFTSTWTANEYNQFAKSGAYVRLDDPENNLIEKYGQELWRELPPLLTKGVMIEGHGGEGVYAVPVYKDIATTNAWDINMDILEKYDFTLDDIRNTDYYGFGDIMKVVKEGEGKDFYPLLIEPAVLERMVTNSVIVAGDSGSNALLSYYISPTNTAAEGAYGNTILNKYGTDEYQKFAEKTREYFLAGYINPACGLVDQANAYRTTTQNEGRYLIGTQSYSYGYELQASAERNIHVEMVPAANPYIDTTSTMGALYAISTASKNPDRAMMVLNLLNTSPELMNLMVYGAEGVHYNTNADGTITMTAEKDNYKPWVNGMGNLTLLKCTEAEGPNFRKDFKAFYDAAQVTPIIGFAFNAETVINEQAALANVAAQYAFALNAGTMDPAVKLPEFLDKLAANGIQQYVDEANKQLQEFMTNK